ncbi:MAG: hypothetical protein LBD23_01695, partial [Oscillospiraceae bacterium]|nr:hypothetical protein [Oscillospiraceae bacterium]
MKLRNSLRRMLALLILIMLILGSMSISAFAGDGCDCSHTHDESCGWAEASPCLDYHEHNEDCFDEYAQLNCTYTHIHDEHCGWAEAKPCNHVCSVTIIEPPIELPVELPVENQPIPDSGQFEGVDDIDDVDIFATIEGSPQEIAP